MDYFGKLLEKYWEFKAFVILHAILIVFVVSSFQKILRETRALNKWIPQIKKTKKKKKRESDTTDILDDFVAECEVLGARGLFVPMTDFSDRIDSHVTGLVSELSDRINLILVVGIAGTIYGVFEFVARSGDVDAQSQAAVQSITTLLEESMTKAFPVGFVGIMLMLVFQLLAAYPEGRFRGSVTDATSKAIGYRKEVTKPQTELMDEVTTRVEASMEPLKDLKNTLSKGIRPVIEELAKRLDSALDLIKLQFDQVQQLTTSFTSSVDGLKKSVQAMEETSNNMEGLLEGVPEMVNTSVPAFKEIQKAATSNLRNAGTLAKRIETIGTNLESLPETIVGGITATLREFHGMMRSLEKKESQHLEERGLKVLEVMKFLTVQTSENINEVTKKVGEDLKIEVQRYVDDVQGRMKETSSDLQRAASEWQRLVANMEEILATPKRTVEEWQTETMKTLTSLQGFIRTYPDVVGSLQEASRETSEAAGKLSDMYAAGEQEYEDVFKQMASRIGEVATLTQSLSRNISAVNTKVDSISTQMVQLQSGKKSLFSRLLKRK